MKKILLLLLLSITPFSFAQDQKSLWKKTSISISSDLVENKRSITNPKLYELNVEKIQSELAKAPQRFLGLKKSAVIISFPNPDDSTDSFYVFESSNMDPVLAAKYPNIKSYVGYGIAKPNTTIYFSISPLGIQTMLLEAGKTAVFIEPYTTDLKTYVVYKKTDKTVLSTFECRVADDIQSNVRTNLAARPNADDGLMRTYRLAVSVTGEYAAYFGGTIPLAVAGINNTMTRVNGVFEKDFGVRMNLIANNDLVIYLNAATDPYSSAANIGNWNVELQNTLTSVIGNAGYDVGHLFGGSGGGGNAGCIGCICVDDTASLTDRNKGSGYTSPSNGIPSGDTFDIDYVAHEFGHQFGGNHTFTQSNEGSGAQMEPGSGSTIMGYAGITSLDVQPNSDAYFHAISIQQITNNIKAKLCSVNTATGNAIPTANAGLDYTIPKSTPFMLTAVGTDANGDPLTYNWEQMDVGNSTTSTPNATKTAGPNFRSYNSTTTPIRYFPRLSSVLAGSTTTAGTELTVEALSSVARTFNFRVTVRDNNPIGPANNSDDMVVITNATAGPFTVNIPNTAVYFERNTNRTITWSVAGTTANGVNCANVDILLSTDGGNTFPITLAAATPNDGSQSVTIPNNLGNTNRIMIKGTNHIFFDISNTNFTIGLPDTVNPSPPTLAASGTLSTATTLTWSGATDNIGIVSYNIYQNGLLINNTSNLTFNVTGLAPLTSYTFTVRTVDVSGNLSIPSNAVSVTTTAPDLTPPNAPILIEYGTNATFTTLSWSGATDNVGVTGYDVYQGAILLGSTTSATTYQVTGLVALTSYTFTVRAKDGTGNISPASNTVSITTLAVNYCTSQGNSVVDELIGNVTIGTINNNSIGGTGYTNFTAISTNLTIGSLQTISITPTWIGTIYDEGYAVFIDYNRDGDFADSGETVFTRAPSKTTPITGTFTIPVSASAGATRMRVSLKYNGIPTSCEIFSFGQVEDYSVILNTAPANTIVNLKLYIEGFYDASTDAMVPVKANQGVGSSTVDVDAITVELRDPLTFAIAATTTANLQTNGNAMATFTTPISGSYYLVIKHRNAIQTWSSNTVTVGSSPLAYDFTNAITNAFGSNMILVDPGIWAFFSGDINQDEVIDGSDSTDLINNIENLNFGVLPTDLNGDGVVDGSDSTTLINNTEDLIFSQHP